MLTKVPLIEAGYPVQLAAKIADSQCSEHHERLQATPRSDQAVRSSPAT
jgi:hypothetical protein